MAGLTIENPVTMAYALFSSNVIPGDTLHIRAGTYSGTSLRNLWSGTGASPVTIKPYQNERVIIDGRFWVQGVDVVLQGLEFTHSADDNTNLDALDMSGVSGKVSVINCIIHDAGGNGCGFWRNVQPGLFYGNLVYFNGRDEPGLRHGLYTQNVAGTVKTIKNNIIFNNQGYGIHAYGTGDLLDDFTFIGNTCFGNQAGLFEFHIGGSQPFENLTVENNYIYGQARVGYGTGNTVTNAVIRNNYFVKPDVGGSALNLTTCVPAEFTNNYFYGGISGWTAGDYPTNTHGAGIPDAAFVRGNEYDANRANLTIYNGSGANTVNVDVSSVFGQTGTVEAHNVQNYFVDIQTLTITGGQITVNMQAANRTVATPVGWTAPATTFPSFGCFVLVKTA